LRQNLSLAGWLFWAQANGYNSLAIPDSSEHIHLKTSKSRWRQMFRWTRQSFRYCPTIKARSQGCRRRKSCLKERGHTIKWAKLVPRHLKSLENEDRYVLSREDDTGRALFWQRRPWLSGARRDANFMTASEAVALSVFGRFAGNKLPETITQEIAPLFKAADVRLSQDRRDSRIYRAWPDKVGSVDGTFALVHPKPAPDIVQVVATATFYERELLVTYRAAYKGENA
jgi:hypothetical protein